MKASAGGQEEQPWLVNSSTTTGGLAGEARAEPTRDAAAAAPRPSAERLLRQTRFIRFLLRKARSTVTHFVVRRRKGLTRPRSRCGGEISQHIGQNAAVTEVVELIEGIDSAENLRLLSGTVGKGDFEVEDFARLQTFGNAVNGDDLGTCEPERFPAVFAHELQRQHTHADQIRAMYALEGLGDHGSHTQKPRSLCRPIARRAGAVFLAGKNHQRNRQRLVL